MKKEDVIYGQFSGKEKPKNGFTWWYELNDEITLVQRRIATLPEAARVAHQKGYEPYRKYLNKHLRQLKSEAHARLVEDIANL